jgi:hypothetical protein
MCPRTVRYFQAGGATDRKWAFYVYTKILFKVPEITTSAYRDLSAILDTQVGGVPCPPPHASLSHEVFPRVI